MSISTLYRFNKIFSKRIFKCDILETEIPDHQYFGKITC
jgi:hypothetical protein